MAEQLSAHALEKSTFYIIMALSAAFIGAVFMFILL